MTRFKTYLLFFLIIQFVYSDVDFIDCGSEGLFVEEIDVPGCDNAPCRVYRGHNYHVYIMPDHLDPRVDSIELEAHVKLWAALFPVSVACSNPCGTDCPLQHYLRRPWLDFTIGFPQTLQRNPSVLYISVVHKNRKEEKSRICVAVNIQLV